MTRSEFLQDLKEALQNESLSAAAIQENVNYYNGYISDEVAKGRSEAEVLDELGDPWVIAKGIVDSPGSAYYQPDATETVYEDAGSRQQQQSTQQESVHIFGLDTWWKKLLAVLIVIMIVVVIITIISGVVSLLAPILIPLIIIMIVIRLLGGGRR